MRVRPTLTQTLIAGALVTTVLVVSLVWIVLLAWERSIHREAQARNELATRRATRLVDDYLARLRRAVHDVVTRAEVGACRLDQVDGARLCLLGSLAVDDSIAEVTFTSASGWQASAYRAASVTAPCTAMIRAEKDR